MATSDHVRSSSRPPTQERSVAEETLYTPERVAAWVRGDLTLAELSAVSGPEMLEMAVVGYSMYEQGRYEDARVIFSGLCALDPKEAYYRTALGAVFLALDDLKRAERCFNVAIKLNDREIASWVNRGEVYLREGKILEAAKDFKRAVELDPHSRDPITQRARTLAAAALQSLEEAGMSPAAREPRSQPAPRSASSAGGRRSVPPRSQSSDFDVGSGAAHRGGGRAADRSSQFEDASSPPPRKKGR